MEWLFAEDSAHDAVLKQIGKPKAAIKICNGRGKVITLTLEHPSFAVGFIDDDGKPDNRFAAIQWLSEDDFKYCILHNKLFIKFAKNAEDWIHRIASARNLDFSEFKLSDSPEDWHRNQKINISSHDTRRFLKAILDADNSPLQLLRGVIDNSAT